MHALALFALALPGGSQEPSLPPTIELSGFTGTEAASFDDLFGQAVLIEFFAHWCAPCARQIPHLNELQERYSGRGLVVLGVTGDAPEDAEEWTTRHGMAFPYAYDPELRLQIDLGFHNLPFAILLDATGAVVWSGKADQLDEKTLEQSLVGALQQPVWSWPEAMAGVRGELARRRYAQALSALETTADQELREGVAALIDRLLDTRVKIGEAALQRGDWLTAHDIATELAPATEGLEVQESFVALLKSVERENDGLLAAQTELRELWRTVSEVASKQDVDELLDAIQAFTSTYDGSYIQAQAAPYQAALTNLRMSLR
jgi:cytochrome c biogenesis protein CcmG/thiol:disulfide interchange protein DsbE